MRPGNGGQSGKVRTHSNAGIKMVEAELLVSLLLLEMRVGLSVWIRCTMHLFLY